MSPTPKDLLDITARRDLFVGLDEEAPLFDGSRRTYVNLDNAATTPPFRAVIEHLNQCVQWYSSVHRGTGFKSLVSTHAFGRCRQRVSEFLGADPNYHAVVFCSNATDAINRLCCRMQLNGDDVVLATIIEHHSNLLPWRFQARMDHVKATWPDGSLDLDHLEERLRHHKGKVRLVAVTGASNVTGTLPPLREIARVVHEHGAQLLVDASQLVAHRRIVMGESSDPGRIDFLAFSGHKMYAPFGSGGLVGPRAFFEQGRPDFVGGGAIDLVTLDDVEWADLPDKEEAGTPNLIGICAMAKAAETLESLGMDNVAAHEKSLTRYALDRLGRTGGIRVFGTIDPADDEKRLGVIPLLAEGYTHGHLAAILGYEWGIGVRNGCFCAQPYVGHLLGISEEEFQRFLDASRNGQRGERPGFVRVSLALYNTEREIDYLAEALESILAHGPKGSYELDPKTHEYAPVGFSYDFDAACSGSATPRKSSSRFP
jgi:cysteine desulfurase/selenocysteine lyase